MPKTKNKIPECEYCGGPHSENRTLAKDNDGYYHLECLPGSGEVSGYVYAIRYLVETDECKASLEQAVGTRGSLAVVGQDLDVETLERVLVDLKKIEADGGRLKPSGKVDRT